jgi:hypothetical protein
MLAQTSVYRTSAAAQAARASSLVPFGARQREIHADLGGPFQPGMAHIVAVPDERHAETADPAALLPEREQVAEDLHGVMGVRQPVDHRNLRIPGQPLDHLVTEGAGHDRVDPSLQIPRRILHRLPFAQADVRGCQVDGVAAELRHTRLEGHPGPERRLLENHGQRLSAEDRMQNPLPSLCLEVGRHLEEGRDVLRRQIVKRYQMPVHVGSSQCKMKN